MTTNDDGGRRRKRRGLFLAGWMLTGCGAGAGDLEVHRGAVARDGVPGARWQRLADPAAAGWSVAGLERARALWRGNSGTSSVLVVWRGVVVAQWGDVAARRTVRSIRKSLLSSLVGSAVAAGALRLNATLGELGVEDVGSPLTAVEKSATVADLLASRSGVYIPAARENAGHRRRRPARGSHAPGTFFYYNNWDFNVLGTLVRDRLGADVGAEFLRRVAQPIGMEDYAASDFEWRRESVSPIPAYDFRMSTRDLARYGLLWLGSGRWSGRQVLDPAWVAESTRSTTSETFAGAGYGRLWWVQPPGRNPAVPEGYFFAEGGSYLWVVPARDLVVVHHNESDLLLLRSRLGLLPNEQRVLATFDAIAAAAPAR